MVNLIFLFRINLNLVVFKKIVAKSVPNQNIHFYSVILAEWQNK